MAERPEDLNLPNAVITRIIKEAVGAQRGLRAGTRTRTGTDRQTRTHGQGHTDTAPPALPVPRVRRPKPPGGSGPAQRRVGFVAVSEQLGALRGIGSEAGTA